MNLGIRKRLALFFVAVLIISILPWSGNSVSALGLFDVPEMMERTETTEESETVITEDSETETNGFSEYAEESETEEPSEAVENTETEEAQGETEVSGTVEDEEQKEDTEEEQTATANDQENQETLHKGAEGEAVPYADIIASGRDNNITWVIDSDGKLTISGTGDFSSSVLFNDNLWGAHRDQITSAELNVTGMTNAFGMFWGCSSLLSADVSGFDTSNVTNMRSMFDGCVRLTSVDVSGFDTRNVADMGGMFYNCSRLTSVDVSGFDTSNVTNMGGMFFSCSSLTSVDVSGFDTSNVTNMGWMFYGCSRLPSVDVSGFDTSNVTDMRSMFDGCVSLTSVDVSGFDTSNATGMGMMFSGCSRLTSVDVSGFDTNNVTNMGYMFNRCSRLTSVDVSGFDTSNVTNMRSMFSDCSSLTSVDVSGFDTRNMTDMGRMFYGCNSLTSVDLSGFDTKNVTDMGEMFYGCSSLTTIHTPYNISQSVSLPSASIPGSVWRLPDGTEVTELPRNLDYSIIITRHDVSPFAVYEGYEFYRDNYGNVTCFDSDGTPVINEFKCDGTYTYYFQADGTAMRDRLTYHPDGVHVIYFDQNGHEVFDNFAYVGHNIPSMETGSATELNEYCYFNTFGYQYTDVVTWGADGTDRAGKLFYANTGGILERSGWFTFSDTVQYAGDGTLWPGAGKRGYANEADCSLMRETWTYDENGLYRYLNGYGALE